MRTEYRSRVPHFHPIGATFFVTFNLKGAIPQSVLNDLKWTKQQNIAQIMAVQHPDIQSALTREHKLYFSRFDKYLNDARESPKWLAQSAVAEIVVQEINRLELDNMYETVCYCIMPNHVHLMIDLGKQLQQTDMEEETGNYVQLEKILGLLKGRSARKANLHLNRTGAFWHKDSYNHYVRDAEEFFRIIEYILQNPVKAALANTWSDWPFNFVHPKYLQ